MTKSPSLKLYDVRTVKKNIDLGRLEESEYKQFVKSLPDDEGQFDVLPFEDPEETMIQDIDEDDDLTLSDEEDLNS